MQQSQAVQRNAQLADPTARTQSTARGKTKKDDVKAISSHFGSSHFLFETMRGVVLSQVSTTRSCSFLFFLMAPWNTCASISGTSLLFEYGLS